MELSKNELLDYRKNYDLLSDKSKKDHLKELKSILPEDNLKRLTRQSVKKEITDRTLRKASQFYKEFEPIKKHFNNVFNCCNVKNLKINSDLSVSINSRYCKSRFCMVCQNIRTAKYLKKFEPFINQNPHFSHIILTVKNVNYEALARTVKRMKTVIKMFSDLIRKNGIVFDFLYSIEITYNIETRTFHPHIHAMGEDHIYSKLKTYWMLKFPDTHESAQHKNSSSNVYQVFKYITKLGQYEPYIYAQIFEAVYNVRLFEQYGIFRKLKTVEPDKKDSIIVETFTGIASNYLISNLDVGLIDQNYRKQIINDFIVKGVKIAKEII